MKVFLIASVAILNFAGWVITLTSDRYSERRRAGIQILLASIFLLLGLIVLEVA